VHMQLPRGPTKKQSKLQRDYSSQGKDSDAFLFRHLICVISCNL
jgi:hypothetical protein